METIKDDDNLKITVKRRTWFIGSFTPVKIQFNGRLIGTVNSFKETEMNILAKKGQLMCTSPMDRESKLNVQAGDRILIKDTLFSRTANILIAVWTILVISNLIYTSLPDTKPEGLFPESGLIVLSVYLILCTGSYFSRQYKIVIND
ncbi:hypothetical protein [Jeotgalicoccus psychrophilus]|uniref:hypothetical protein n=1 Tax=Jeotgalicoccus psychrophilus TaxID=157228 RepID=UPI0004084EDC|nr:hypothetical protein [Jeotgalicoccus psychrophilus]